MTQDRAGYLLLAFLLLAIVLIALTRLVPQGIVTPLPQNIIRRLTPGRFAGSEYLNIINQHSQYQLRADPAASVLLKQYLEDSFALQIDKLDVRVVDAAPRGEIRRMRLDSGEVVDIAGYSIATPQEQRLAGISPVDLLIDLYIAPGAEEYLRLNNNESFSGAIEVALYRGLLEYLSRDPDNLPGNLEALEEASRQNGAKAAGLAQYIRSFYPNGLLRIGRR